MATNVIVPPFTEAPETVVGGTPQSVFPFEFPYWSSDDILVYVDGVLLDAADYTVAGLAIQSDEAVEGGFGSGTVTLDTAVSSCTVTIDRSVVGDRQTQFSRSIPLDPRALNGDLNRVTARQQDLQRHKLTTPAFERAGKFLAFDSEGEPVAATGTGADSALRSDLAEETGAALSGTIQPLTGAVQRSVRSKLNDTIDARDFGADPESDDDQTAIIQAALDVLPSSGVLNIPRGVKFNRKNLTYPRNGWMLYFVDDQLNPPPFGSQLASGERVRHSFNSSYVEGVNDNGGTVNEERFVGAWHEGLCVITLTDTLGHDQHLGTDQEREVDPALVSHNFFFDDVAVFSMVAKNSFTASALDGMQFYGHRNTWTLNGVGTSTGAWAVTPVKGALLVGATSGAKAIVAEVTSGAIEAIWQREHFEVGEAVIHAGETSASVITSIGAVRPALPPLSQDFRLGNWSIDIPPGVVLDKFAVGGLIVSAGSRDFGQHTEGHLTERGFAAIDTYEEANPANIDGLKLWYDTTEAAADRRWYGCRYGESVKRQHINAMGAHINFSNTRPDPANANLAFGANGHNITSVVRNGDGDYTITFAVDFVRADYTETVYNTSPSDHSFTYVKNESVLRIQNYATGTTTLTDLVGRVNVTIVGGDK